MGVNIGDLEAVAMRNVPPSPANYAQRSGRTGRVSRMGIVAGFSRNTPHDGYFFDHPGEIISGAIPPPRFNLDNLEAIARHARSLVLEHAELDIPHNLANYLTDKGQPIEHAIQDLLAKIQAGAEPAVSSRAASGPTSRRTGRLLRDDRGRLPGAGQGDARRAGQAAGPGRRRGRGSSAKRSS